MQQNISPTPLARHRWDIANAFLAPFGRACIKLGEWPHRDVVAAAVAAMREAGGVVSGEDGTPCDEVRNVYFKVRGRRLRLCIEDYADVTLWGPRRLVRELSDVVAAKMRTGKAAG